MPGIGGGEQPPGSKTVSFCLEVQLFFPFRGKDEPIGGLRLERKGTDLGPNLDRIPIDSILNGGYTPNRRFEICCVENLGIGPVGFLQFALTFERNLHIDKLLTQQWENRIGAVIYALDGVIGLGIGNQKVQLSALSLVVLVGKVHPAVTAFPPGSFTLHLGRRYIDIACLAGGDNHFIGSMTFQRLLV
ncbi:hypothetical protein SDC9_53582 [bioreactor metagenome]|uniref:Uncharacterized protein n=1 Tax=bioreactor metagenome TaxID=1076179 RepID=A0A644WTM4_9ZZZZ